MFIDEAIIYVEGGRGGDGCVSFRREKYRPHGGPDGGGGGDGGDVALTVSRSRGTLGELHKKRHHKAKNGARGRSQDKSGRRGEDLVIAVPPGTVVKDEEGSFVFDLVQPEQSFVAARGGRGGRGNASLVAEAGPLPGFAEKGEPGESRSLHLELKLVADVAIVGFPNAGKSTLISRISRARPKIADYPFTTTEPNLGVVEGDDIDFVVTDVPGLIPGAHEGKGMGIDFLRHIERAAIMVYLIDMSPGTGRRPEEELASLEEELGLFNPELTCRRRVVVANKMDLDPPLDSLESLRGECGAMGLELLTVSAATGQGIPSLLGILERMVGAAREEGVVSGEAVTYTPTTVVDMMTVRRKGDRFIVTGKSVERMALMTDRNNEEALDHLARKLRRAGVDEKLTLAGAKRGDEVEVAGIVFEYIPDSGEPFEVGKLEGRDRGGGGHDD